MQHAVDFNRKDQQYVLIMWQILTLGPNIHSDLLPGTSFRTNPHKYLQWALLVSPITDLLRHTQPNTSSTAVKSWAAPKSGIQVFQVLLFCHLPGAVPGHAHSHCGHRHGNGINASAPWLHLHLTWDLPLLRERIESTSRSRLCNTLRYRRDDVIYKWIIYWLLRHLLS